MARDRRVCAREAALRFLVDELGAARSVVERGGLVTRGVLDSAALVRLAAVLEESCEVTIPDRDLVPEHFDSLAAIEAYVACLVG